MVTFIIYLYGNARIRLLTRSYIVYVFIKTTLFHDVAYFTLGQYFGVFFYLNCIL